MLQQVLYPNQYTLLTRRVGSQVIEIRSALYQPRKVFHSSVVFWALLAYKIGIPPVVSSIPCSWRGHAANPLQAFSYKEDNRRKSLHCAVGKNQHLFKKSAALTWKRRLGSKANVPHSRKLVRSDVTPDAFPYKRHRLGMARLLVFDTYGHYYNWQKAGQMQKMLMFSFYATQLCCAITSIALLLIWLNMWPAFLSSYLSID